MANENGQMTYREVALLAAKWFGEISSSDGSGHADLAERIKDMVCQIDSNQSED